MAGTGKMLHGFTNTLAMPARIVKLFNKMTKVAAEEVQTALLVLVERAHKQRPLEYLFPDVHWEREDWEALEVFDNVLNEGGAMLCNSHGETAIDVWLTKYQAWKEEGADENDEGDSEVQINLFVLLRKLMVGLTVSSLVFLFCKC